MRIRSILTAVTLSLVLNVQAHADVPTTTVKFADLDLSTRHGDRELYSRLGKAATTVCSAYEKDNGPMPLPMKVSREHAHAYCMRQAIVGAAGRINNATFTTYLAAQGLLPSPPELALR